MILLLAILLAVFLVPSPWSIVVLVAGCLLEIVEIVVLRRWSKRLDRETKPTTGVEGMLGKRGKVAAPCRPTGNVVIDGELWEARCDAGAARGEPVLVQDVDGLTLVVRPVAGAGA